MNNTIQISKILWENLDKLQINNNQPTFAIFQNYGNTTRKIAYEMSKTASALKTFPLTVIVLFIGFIKHY